jgi:uncharacterized cupin superfamily protein
MPTMPADTPQPPHRPIASDGVPWESWSEGERFGSRYRHLTRSVVGDAYHVGVQIEEIPPGKQSAPAHYHLREEEHLLVLEGSCTLRLGDERHALRAGDYACFPAAQRAGHCIVNEGDTACRLLVIGERSPDDVAVYTDTAKVMVRALREIYDRRATRAYWEGEQTGRDQE